MKFETSVRIERAIDEVFDYVSDPRNFPRWNSAVQAVSVTSGEGGPRSTYLMERELPGGPAENELEILDRDRPTEFAVRTTSGPTPLRLPLPIRLRRPRDGCPPCS
jgi:uncharacterized protein YndB with AHSA1/START domain